ncbi:FAD-dependent oxidoreductase [Saccharothrix luteola]|uniref:FAD-dependent oxidoreductase n=1 Tax=Saccharothrix luteola TaxID=2893018 RepID=UPI001E641A05|nr:FAD-dependent monooxygenase [Saccharothrix luteola]MCC8243872.1 FAD-binding monooxygenase [Saccharothrix luteola]
MDNKVGDRALVLGGSMAGMLAARVLSEAYAEVVVVDRDELVGVAGARRGVPQGRHVHGLLARGLIVLDELFPGFTDGVRAAGVNVGDMGRDLRWYFNGTRLAPVETGLYVAGGDRPTLEHHVRTRVASIPNVRFVEGHDVVEPVFSPDGHRVVGARIQRRAEGSTPETVTADLVVDATGRGSRTPAWLESAGYPRVEEERVKIGLAYCTRRYALSSDHFGGDVSINPVATPDHRRGGFLTTVGEDRWALSLTGIFGDHAPTDPEGFLAFAKSLPVPEVYEAVRDAEPLDDPVAFQFPANARKRYERMSRFPAGLLVLGDAVCTFNPVYGQGMTTAGLQTLTLREHLRQGTMPNARAFFADIAKVLDAPWDIAAGGDLAYPDVVGPRPLKARMGNSYMPKVQVAATRDPRVARAFLRVAGLVDPPTALMRPGLALRVLRQAKPEAGPPGRRAA